MAVKTSPWRAGIPCWVDLGSPAPASSAAFYRSVLGWTVPAAVEGGDGAVVAERRGAAVAGLGPVRDGAPAGWTVHFATQDADAAARSAVAAGGTLLSSPCDVGTAGRAGLAADPQGVVFGLWQARDLVGSSLVNEPGGLCWEELRTADAAASQAFYGGLFGYDFDAVPEAGPDYAVFRLPDETVPLGAITGPDADGGEPARWLPFFGVDDAHAAGERTQQAGGTVLLPDFETPEGRMAQLADPEGAPFWVITSTGEAQPDRSG